MIENNKYPIEFYKNLGNVFYAIAAADNVVREEEFKRLEELVTNDWLPSNIKKNSSLKIITSTFKFLLENNTEAKASYSSFIAYEKKHGYLFTETVNSLIMKAAGKIASSFSNLNKSELIMLANLSIELKKINP